MSRRDEVTVARWVAEGAARYGERPAVLGVEDGRSLSHAGLARLVDGHARALRSWGIGTGDVVLVALPDGPMSLAVLVSVASVAIALPVAAQEQPDEYGRILDEVPVAAILMEDRPSSPLTALAAVRGITLVTVTNHEGAHPARSELAVVRPRQPTATDPPGPDDDALYILTSGTTAAPKIVALTHTALRRQLDATKAAFDLDERDRSLCMMPLTHMHGIVRATLSALVVGGSAICAPGFDARRILDWIERLEPTYLTAAPAVQRKLLGAVKAAAGPPDLASLRRLGIGSDRTEPGELSDLREAFGVPVVQMYGMTETAPLIATTPLEATDVPAGSVGRIDSAWRAVCLDASGHPVAAGASGELAVEGGIINRLVGRSMADVQRFDEAGRFLTGDIGRIDTDGFLFVEGRVDGMINRGGQKVNPAVVETVFAAHPAVRTAAAFADPDPVLGSRVAVAVELEDGASATTDELLEHAGRHLRRYMVPQRVVFTAALARNRMGKVARAEVARQLAGSVEPADRAPTADAAPPRSSAATSDDGILAGVLAVFATQLEGADIDPDVGFFELGGDSLGSLNVLIEVEERFRVSVPPATFERASSARALAATIARSQRTAPSDRATTTGRLVGIRDGQELPPLVFAHGLSGSDFLGPLFARLDLVPGHALGSLEADRAMLQEGSLALDGMTRGYARLLVEDETPSPVLVGHSMGAHVAFAAAAGLVAEDAGVELVVAIDDDVDLTRRRFGIETEPLAARSVAGYVRRAMERSPLAPAAVRVLLVRCEEDEAAYRSDPTGGWAEVALGGVDVVSAPGNHHTLVRDSRIDAVADRIVDALRAVRSAPATFDPIPDPQRQARLAARRACVHGDLEGEIGAYREALALDAEQPSWVYENLGAALLQAGDDAAGLAALDEAVARDDWPLSVDLRLIDTWLTRGDDTRAAAALERASVLPADHASVFEQHARLLFATARFEEAEGLCRAGLELAPEHLELHLVLGRVLARQRRFVDAVRVLDEAKEQTPGLDLIVLPLARTLVRSGDPDRALDVLDELPALRTHPHASTIRGLAMRDLGREDDALDAFRRSTELGPRLAEPHYEASVILRRRGRSEEALEAARRAAERPDATPAMRAHAERLAGRGPGAVRTLWSRVSRRAARRRRR